MSSDRIIYLSRIPAGDNTIYDIKNHYKQYARHNNEIVVKITHSDKASVEFVTKEEAETAFHGRKPFDNQNIQVSLRYPVIVVRPTMTPQVSASAVKYCTICNREYASERHLDQHIARCHNGNSIRCEICGKTYSADSSYRRHVLQKHPSSPIDQQEISSLRRQLTELEKTCEDNGKIRLELMGTIEEKDTALTKIEDEMKLLQTSITTLKQKHANEIKELNEQLKLCKAEEQNRPKPNIAKKPRQREDNRSHVNPPVPFQTPNENFGSQPQMSQTVTRPEFNHHINNYVQYTPPYTPPLNYNFSLNYNENFDPAKHYAPGDHLLAAWSRQGFGGKM